ncbi:hypothetical protein QBC37DRAFT_396247 [Rhypophila decipiens]|uniref:Uncharacterized protein n=1 Tax=Rhypophila decipiens TaxID=261697 RepID=A0AAN6YEQ6_9PEZI|nr:hypothetical protein QBC37DRAFT_396247 [Rhypophila decipiens]
MSSGASTPSAPSSPKSDVFSVSHFPIRRDSESTASTAPSSVESAATEGKEQFPCGETRPVLVHAKTSSAVPTLSSSSKLGGHTFSEAAAASTPVTPSTEAHKHDPLSRAFPKPTTTATVEEMLARNPGKWSLNHWIKHGAEPRARAVKKEAEARRFVEAKAALLKSHQDLNGGRSG